MPGKVFRCDKAERHCRPDGGAGAGIATAHDGRGGVAHRVQAADLVARPLDLPAITADTPLPSMQEPSDHLAVMAWFDWSDVVCLSSVTNAP